MGNFLQVYNKIKDKNKNELKTRDSGTIFEELVKKFLIVEPVYKNQYKKVFLWKEFKEIEENKDLGIDLVAEKYNGDYCAIQCKFVDRNKKISKDEINSFLAESGRVFKKIDGSEITFTSKIIVTTAEFNDNANDTIYSQEVEVRVIGWDEFKNSEINFEELLSNENYKAEEIIIKKEIKDYQAIAIEKVIEGFKELDRGKLIMACGSGKTFTSLKIIEKFIDSVENGDFLEESRDKKLFNILFVVPSLSLLSQTLKAFNYDQDKIFDYFAVCSDSSIGKEEETTEESLKYEITRLACPATTKAESLIKNLQSQSSNRKYRIILSTYHSLGIIKELQKKENAKSLGLDCFDLIICDEAHKTVKMDDNKKQAKQEDSYYTIIHNNENVNGKKRLYMTATPKIYTENAKQKANNQDLICYSMDDEAVFGKDFYTLSFSEAVRRKILTDYKVLILTIDKKEIEKVVNKEEIQTKFKENKIIISLVENKRKNTPKVKNNKAEETPKVKNNKADETSKEKISEIFIDDIAKLVGCYNALSGNILTTKEDENNPSVQKLKENGIKRAVAFYSSIPNSRLITGTFEKIISILNEEIKKEREKGEEKGEEKEFSLSVRDIDGGMDSLKRREKLDWLKESPKDRECKILNNVKLLTEGVDVPTLDCIMFMNSKKSEVDIIQAVGRVMRTAAGKDFGYIVLPIVLATDADADAALTDSKDYHKIWEVIKAIKSHDDKFEIPKDTVDVAKNRLNERVSVISTNIIGSSGATKDNKKQDGDDTEEEENKKQEKIEKTGEQLYLALENEAKLKFYKETIFARAIDIYGTNDSIKITENMKKALIETKARIHLTLKESSVAKNEFNKFIAGLQKDINNAIDFDAGVDMLACHIICKPVFESLFEDNKFIANNSVSKLMEVVLKSLEMENPILRKTDYLKNYNSAIYEKLKSVKSFKDKQTYIKNFYGDFIKASQEKEAEKHGVVYTPIEVIDFIINSVEDVLKNEFNLSLDDKGVNILDPFSGTGTFITRLLQSGILKNNLVYKYQNEIFANEILLFSYYVASINIESSMVEELKDKNRENDKENISEYLEFNGMVLTDTFNMNENDVEEKGNDRFKLDDFEFDNSEKIAEQKKKAIKVIIGNPPYSLRQGSENDNNKKIKYKKLDSSIENSYVKDSLATKIAVYDSYIRAIKWSSNRLAKEESGIVAFIVNNGFIKAKGMDGLRKHLAMDYDKIYMLDLKGNSRNLGEAKLEGGNIFDIRTGVVIIILVKGGKKNNIGEKQILYANIGDGLKKEEKFERLKSLKGISGIKGYLEDGALDGNILPLEGNNAVEYGGGYFLNK